MAHQSRREEDAGATIKLRSAARQAEELKEELAVAKSEAVDKTHQLKKCRDEVGEHCAPHMMEYSPIGFSKVGIFGEKIAPNNVLNDAPPENCHYLSPNSPLDDITPTPLCPIH